MKKLINILLTIIFLLPLTIFAKELNIKDIELNITLSDEDWYIFTKENINNYNQTELEEKGFNYDILNEQISHENIHLLAALFYEDNSYIQYTIKRMDIGLLSLMDNMNEKDIKEIYSSLIEKDSGNSAKILNVESYESNNNYIVINYRLKEAYTKAYFTIVNESLYIIDIVKNKEFNDVELEKIKNTIDSIKYNEPKNIVMEKAKQTILKIIKKENLIKIGVGVGIIIILIITIIIIKNKKENKKFDF